MHKAITLYHLLCFFFVIIVNINVDLLKLMRLNKEGLGGWRGVVLSCPAHVNRTGWLFGRCLLCCWAEAQTETGLFVRHIHRQSVNTEAFLTGISHVSASLLYNCHQHLQHVHTESFIQDDEYVAVSTQTLHLTLGVLMGFVCWMCLADVRSCILLKLCHLVYKSHFHS